MHKPTCARVHASTNTPAKLCLAFRTIAYHQQWTDAAGRSLPQLCWVQVSLVGLWLIPGFVAFHYKYWLFLAVRLGTS